MKYWNTLKILKNKFSHVVWNKWQNTDREDVIRKEVEKLSSSSVSLIVSNTISQNYRSDLPINNPFSLHELRRAIRMIRKKISVPGKEWIIT